MATPLVRSPTTRRRRGLRWSFRSIVLVAATLASSCSSSGNSSPTTSETSATAAETTTTSSATTTTASPPATSSTTTTTTQPPAVVDTVPPSEPPTTAAVDPADTTPLEIPTDTMFAPDTTEGEIEQAVLGFYASFVRCLEQLPNCDVEQASAFTVFDYGEANAELIGGWNSTGSRARNTETYRYRFLGIDEFAEDGTEATVTTCTSTEVDIFIPATDDQPEQITFGEPESRIQGFRVQRLGDLWYIAANRIFERNFGEEENLCP